MGFQGGTGAQRTRVVQEGMGYLDPYSFGGSYGPERLMALFNQSYGGDIPQMQAVNPGMGRAYAQQAMDIAGQSAMNQAGAASQRLQGMNPAARAAALTDISRGAASQVGNIGANAYQAGLGFGQQANMVNQNTLMQDRMAALGLFGQGAGSAFQGAAMGANELWTTQRERWRLQEEARQRRQQAIGQAVGALGGALIAKFVPGGAAMPMGTTVQDDSRIG